MPSVTTTNDPGIQTQAGTSGGSQQGTIANTQGTTATQTGGVSGQQAQGNVYQPWQSQLQQTAGNAAGNYVTSGAPPPGVTGAPPQLVQAYTDSYNQNVAPVIAAGQGPGSSAIGSGLALGLEQLNAGVYGTNLSAYQNAIAQAGGLGFNSVGTTGTQGQTTTGATNQQSTSNTNQNQNWQQAMADLLSAAGNTTTTTISP